MAKEYWIKFATDQLNSTSGLSPTLILFRGYTGAAITAPGITQPIASFGLYRFEYSPSFSIVFVCDGATTSLGANRFVTGTLDPVDAIDERVTEMGVTVAAIGTTAALYLPLIYGQGVQAAFNISLLIGYGATTYGYATSIYAQGTTGFLGISQVLGVLGTTASSIGSTGIDPGDVIGYLKRLQELQEGNASFDKTTGVWQIKSRGATLLREKTLADSTSSVTKT